MAMTEAPGCDVTAAERIRPQKRPHRPQWRRAIRALRQLLAHPKQTQHAFTVSAALDGDSAELGLRRMLSQAQGRDLFLARPDLGALLSDRAALARLPEGSFGRAYLDHLDRYGLDSGKLVSLGKRQRRDEPALAWSAARQQLSHDLWHVLTGCGADGAGEAELLAFSYAQNGGLGNLLLTFGASSRTWGRDHKDWPRVVWRSYRRGRNAICLAALPYEELLPLPLEDVRAAVGLPSRS